MAEQQVTKTFEDLSIENNAVHNAVAPTSSFAYGGNFQNLKIENVQGQVNLGGHRQTTIGTIHYGSSCKRQFDDLEQNDLSMQQSIPEAIMNSTTPINTDNMYHVAQNITDWKMLARYLPGGEFESGNIGSIEHDHKNEGLVEIVYQVLDKWRQRSPENATVGTLAHVLQKIKHTNIACKLEP